MNFKKIGLKEINLIVAILGFGVFMLVFYLGYNPTVEKNEELEAQITEKNAYLTQLNEYYDNLSVYKEGIEESKANLEKNLNSLPAGITEEDFLVYMMDLCDEVGTDFASISFETGALVSEFECLVDDKTVPMQGYRAGTVTSSSLSYDQFKAYFDYVYNKTDEVTFIDSIALNYNAESAKLEAAISMSKLYLTYEGADYVPKKVPNVPLGTENPFGALTSSTEQE